MKLSGTPRYSEEWFAVFLKERRLVKDSPHAELLNSFMTSLSQTIRWCSKHASIDDPKNSLRSFVPSLLIRGSMEEQVSDATNKRDIALRISRSLPTQLINDLQAQWFNDLQGGRLLVFYPDGTLSDGAARIETQGYFDDDNVPPADTWVSLIIEHAVESQDKDTQLERTWPSLISWVPPKFVSMVDKGIKVNPEECILWLDDVDSPFTRLLDEHHLLKP